MRAILRGARTGTHRAAPSCCRARNCCGSTPAGRRRSTRQRLEREAQRAQHFALLRRLAAGVSHEIRNPLGAVCRHVDLLEEELRQPSPDSAMQIAQSFTEIKMHLARLDDLVQDYLSLVRASTIERKRQFWHFSSNARPGRAALARSRTNTALHKSARTGHEDPRAVRIPRLTGSSLSRRSAAQGAG